MPGGSSLFILLDADGCVFNRKIHDLVSRIIDGYGGLIKRYVKHPDETGKQELVNHLISFIHAQDVTVMSRKTSMVKRKDTARVFPQHWLDEESLFSLRSGSKRQLDVMRQMMIWLDMIDPVIMDTVIVHANHVLFDDIIKRTQAMHYEQITLMIGSNRQSANYDAANNRANGTVSFYRAMPVIQKHLKQALQRSNVSCDVELDKFLTADIFGDRVAGEAYKHASVLPEFDHRHIDTVYDHDKVLMIYAFAHYIAHHYSHHAAHDILFYDNNIRIMDALKQVFGDNLETMLPSSVSLCNSLYDGYLLEDHSSLSGEADYDPHFRHSVKLMAMICGGDPWNVNGFSTKMAAKLDISHFLDSRARMHKNPPEDHFSALYGLNLAVSQHDMELPQNPLFEAPISNKKPIPR